MDDRTYLFEKAPIPKALASFAIPTIISQIISMIYNIADTMFIGKTNNPYMVAAATMSFALFMTLNALGQLFGIGGGVVTSRLLGEYKEGEAHKIGTFSFYCSLLICIIYSLLLTIFMTPILKFLGASVDTIEYSRQYAIWVVCIGGFPTILSIALSHLIRSEGYSKEASFGLSMGGIINIILDPIFMFVIFPSLSPTVVSRLPCRNLTQVRGWQNDMGTLHFVPVAFSQSSSVPEYQPTRKSVWSEAFPGTVYLND